MLSYDLISYHIKKCMQKYLCFNTINEKVESFSLIEQKINVLYPVDWKLTRNTVTVQFLCDDFVITCGDDTPVITSCDHFGFSEDSLNG